MVKVTASAPDPDFVMPTATVDERIYGGQYVLILGDKIVAHGRDYHEISRIQKTIPGSVFYAVPDGPLVPWHIR